MISLFPNFHDGIPTVHYGVSYFPLWCSLPCIMVFPALSIVVFPVLNNNPLQELLMTEQPWVALDSSLHFSLI